MTTQQRDKFTGAKYLDEVSAYAKLTVGAAGAVGSYSGKGILSVAKTANVGEYTITLDEAWDSLIFASGILVAATHEGLEPQITDDSASDTTPSVTIQFASAEGTATNPAENTVVYFHLIGQLER